MIFLQDSWYRKKKKKGEISAQKAEIYYYYTDLLFLSSYHLQVYHAYYVDLLEILLLSLKL